MATYDKTAGIPPVITKKLWLVWYFLLLKRRVDECPRERTTRYFFAQSGNDANDGRDGLGTNVSNANWVNEIGTLNGKAYAGYLRRSIGTWSTAVQYGDQLYIKAGTGLTVGLYTVVGKSGDSIKMYLETAPSAVDTTANNGTTSNGPKQTLASCQTLLNANPVNTRFSFRRGDVWKETAGLAVTASSHHLTFDDYHTVASGKNKPSPKWSRFNASVAAGSWTKTGGRTNIWQTTVSAGTMGWCRREHDVKRVMRKQPDLATLDTSPEGWFHTGTTLYIHTLGSVDPSTNNDAQYEYVFQNNVEGITFANGSYNVRMQNIRLDGWGMSPVVDGSYDGYAVHSYMGGDAALLLINVEAYYNNRHNIGLTSNSGQGGIITLIDCRYGWCKEGGCVVSYAGNGGNESINHMGICVGGETPIGNQPYSYGAGTTAYHCHTSGADTVGLFISYKTRVVAGQFQANSNTAPANIINWTDLADCRCFLVDDEMEVRTPSGLDATISTNNLAVVNFGLNPKWSVTVNKKDPHRLLGDGGVVGDKGIITTSLVGVYINSVVIFDFIGASGGGFYYAYCPIINPPGLEWQGFYNCRLHWEIPGFGKAEFSHNTVANSSNPTYAVDTYMANCVFSSNGTEGVNQTFNLGINDQAGRLMFNAYIGVSNKTLGTYAGYANDAGGVESNWTPIWGPPRASSDLVRAPGMEALVKGYPLEYDMNWDDRDPNQPVTGPFVLPYVDITREPIEARENASFPKVMRVKANV